MPTGLFQIWKQKKKKKESYLFFVAFSCIPALAFSFGGCFHLFELQSSSHVLKLLSYDYQKTKLSDEKPCQAFNWI